MNLQRLQKDSDAKFRIKIKDHNGRVFDPGVCDLYFEFYTSRTSRIEIEHKRGENMPEGMSIEGEEVVIAIDKPQFTEGILFVKFKSRVYDGIFPDGHYDFSSGEVKTNIIVRR